MTTYLGDKAVGIGTVKAEIGVTGIVLHDDTLVGNGNTEPLGVNTANIVSQQTLANTVSVLNTAIDAQADAIAKTRNDFEIADQNIRADMNEKDSELEHIITEHAEELTTLRGNQASLGDQVSNIESKIPESASETNPLITKQQLLDEERDIRDDYNELVSELQTQITAQAGAIAGKQDELVAGTGIKIDGNVISATGGGGGGIANVIHDSTLTGKGTDDEPLGVAKNLEVEELTVGTDEGTLNLSITAGVATIATNNGLDIVSPTKFDKAPTTDDNTTWADALDTSLVRKAQVVTAIAQAGGGELPDQTGNAGKFLTTDGTEASWGELPDNVLVNNSSLETALSIGTNANADAFGVALGNAAKTLSTGSIAIGSGSNGNGVGIAIGMQAKTGSKSKYAIQLGFNATNSDSNTFKVSNANGNFEMMSADGTIPLERLTKVTDQIGDISTALTAILGE